jgi:hypothetical protein
VSRVIASGTELFGPYRLLEQLGEARESDFVRMQERESRLCSMMTHPISLEEGAGRVEVRWR